MHDPYNGQAVHHPSASASTSASPSASTQPSQASFLSRRALQLQAEEEAFRCQPTYRTASIANDSDPIFEPAESSRSTRGRARAGTLPSSWGDTIPTLQPPSQIDPRPLLSHISPAQRPVHDLTRVGSASQIPASNDSAHFDHDLASSSSSQRFRSGSLTLPTANLANAFGPSFFSSHWQPTRSGLSTMTSAANEDDPTSPSHAMDAAGPRFSFDNADMLDYLGLGAVDRRESNAAFSSHADTSQTTRPSSNSDHDFADSNAYLTSAQFRNRSSTLGVQQLRPRLNNGEGRARSSSYLPSFAFSPSEAASESASQPTSNPAGTRSGHLSGSQSPYAGNAPHSSLLNTALHNRLHQYGATSSAQGNDCVNRASASSNRPRATSMGVLDQPHSRAPMSSQFRAGPSGVLPSTLGGFDPSPTPPGYAGHLHLPVTSPGLAPPANSTNDLSAFLANGRNRAGTIAAFSGPGGRARAEQALLRMTQMQYEASLARDTQSRPSSSSASEASSMVDVYGHARTQQQQHQQRPGSQKSGATSPFVQPTRTLWIGQLRPTITSSDLLQILSRYGSIETIRLVPEKSCAFVNFVEVADAVRAKEDLAGCLGSRLGLGTMGPEGQVRVGFGKPESVPQAGFGGFAPTSETLAGPADGVGNEAFGAEPVNQEASRALWIGSIPSTTSTETLVSIFAPFGSIESIRVLASKSCAFINFDRLDDAMVARKALHGREVLGPEVGPVRIGFAKVPARVSDSYFGSLDPGSLEFQAAMDALASLSGVVPGTPLENSQMSRGMEDPRHSIALDGLSRHHYLQPNALNAHGLVRNLSADAARLPTTGAPGRVSGFPAHSSSNSIVPSSDKGGVPLPAEMKPKATINDLQMLMRELDETDPGVEADIARIARPTSLVTYFTRIPPVPELPPGKRFDNNRLKEVRKRLETPNCLPSDADAIARDYLPCVVDLSSDFIGNTLVQKFFERCSEPMKKTMLELIAPHLAMIGVHKNGTWAAQKIIDCTHADDQRAIIAQHIRPYVSPLLLDQFGNYVVQRLIPFGSPHSDFIFEAMVDRCWEVAQGRFGSRSMRACLESAQVPKFHIKQVALAIVLNSVPLATSQNGALLVTWLLDASALPGRFRLLAPRFAPHLASLCTHKLASQTVLRVISQKTDVEASRLLLRVLFEGGRPQLLEEILVDQVHGSQFVTKLFAEADVLEGAERQRCSEDVKALLIKHGLVNMPPYRPLAVEMGLLPSVNVNNASAPVNTNNAGSIYGTTAALERQLASMHVGNTNSTASDGSAMFARRELESEPLWSHPSPSPQDAYDPYNPVFAHHQQQRNEHFSMLPSPQHSYQHQQHHLHDSRTFF